MSSDACPVYNLSRQLSALLCSVDFAELFSGVVEPSIETNSAPGPPAPQIFKSLSALVRMLRDPHQLAMSLVKTHGDAIRSDRVVLAQFSTFLNCFKAAEICLSGILNECAKQAVGPSGNALTHLPSSSPGPSAYHQPTAQLLTSGSNNSQNAIARSQDPAKQVNIDRPSKKLKTHAETSFDTCSAAADIESSSLVSLSKDRSLSLHRSEDVVDSQGDEMEKNGSPSQEHGADIRVRRLARSNSCIIRAERAAKAAERRREATISSTSKYQAHSAVAPLPHISSTPVAASSVDSRPPSPPSASSPVEGMRKFSMVETIEMIRSIAQNVVWANEEKENLQRALSESLQQPQPSGALDSNSVVSHAPDEATTDEKEEESINPLRPGGCPGWRIHHLDHCPYEFRVGPAKRPVGKEALMRPSSPSEVHSPPSTSETSSAAPPANKGKKRAREEDESGCQHPAQRSRKGTVNDPQNLLDSESETNAESILITNFPTSPSRKRSHSPGDGEEPRSGGLTKRRKGA